MNQMRPIVAAALAFAAALAAAPLASANNPHPGVGIVHGGGSAPPPSPIAKTCSGPSVTIWVRENGHREKECKCAPGAVGQLIENRSTGAKELRCLREAGPRP
jgi:hypothetical protein